MTELDLSFFLPLVIAWFLLYWVLGGVVFSLLALIRVHRIRRVRFGCLFTFTAIGVAAIGAWGSIRMADGALLACELPAPSTFAASLEAWIQLFACGIVPFSVVFVGGFVLLLFVGFILLALSKRNELTWVEPTLQEDDLETEEHSH